MPINQDTSHNHPDQGMTPADMQAAQLVAAERNEIIMFRDTGCWSRPYIAAGHPTKPFHVKGKSADWGPQAGLVPLNSEFSKAFAQKDIDKGIAANRHAIQGNYARPIPLFVSEQFVQNELLVRKGSANRPPIDRVTRPRPGIIYFFCTKPNDDPHAPGRPYVLFGKKESGDRYQIFTFPLDAARTKERELFLKESSGEPLLVMTVPGADLPITGDYDLFAVCPSWGNYGAEDKKMDPTLDDQRQNASWNRTAAKAAFSPDIQASQQARISLAKIEAAKTPEDPDRGNLTPRILELIGSLTAAMGGRFPRVHHNAESGRPFAPGAADGFPVTTFHPKRGIGGYQFLNATINDVGDLRQYFSAVFADGYYVPRNRAWNMPNLNPRMGNFPALDNVLRNKAQRMR
jgi:Anthrax toxin LF subunit